MKFLFFFLPTIPATLDERRKLRPIANRTEYFQKMIDEVVEMSRLAEDVGFDAVAFPEHHLHGEGLEMGSLPVLTQHVIHNTKHIKVGPIGYVLPGWNPMRLALEIAWLDQLTKGRTLIGFARGYQTRWLNQMAQKIHVSATVSDRSEVDRTNREAFEEVFRILKLAWGDEPFRFKGKHYEFPYPYETGTPWAPHEWTREYGAPGEVDEKGNIHAINLVPKPYQKPHPPLFQAFSVSEETVRWTARERITPSILISDPKRVRELAEIYRQESAANGRKLNLGESIGVLRTVYLGQNREEARQMAEEGAVGLGFRKFFYHFGFWEAWRSPEDDAKYPGRMLPLEECTIDRVERAKFSLIGDVNGVRGEMDALAENANPEWFMWQGEQGLLPAEVVKNQIRTFGEKIISRFK